MRRSLNDMTNYIQCEFCGKFHDKAMMTTIGIFCGCGARITEYRQTRTDLAAMMRQRPETKTK